MRKLNVLMNGENQNRINREGCDWLDSWLRLFEEGQSLEKFDPTITIDHWFNSKVRRLTSSSHKYPGKGRRLQNRTVVDLAKLTLSGLKDEEDNLKVLIEHYIFMDWTLILSW